MAMSAKFIRVLDKYRVELVRDIEPDDVVDHLISDKVLVPDDVDLISSKQMRKEKVRCLLDLIKRRGNKAFESFMKALADENCGHIHLYESIKKKLEEEEEEEDKHEHEHELEVESRVPHGMQCTETNSKDLTDSCPVSEVMPNQSSDPGYDFTQFTRDSPLNPDKMITDKLVSQLASNLSQHWEELASALGMGPNVVYRCKMENQYNLWAQVNSMLIIWRNKEYKKANIGELVRALKKCEVGREAYQFLMEA